MFGVARLVIDYDRRAVGITYQQVDNALNEHALARIPVAVQFARASVVNKIPLFCDERRAARKLAHGLRRA